MSALQKVFSDSAFTAFRSVVTMARGLVVIPLITNLLGAESYGVWVTVFAAVGLLSSTGGMHLHGSLVRYTSPDGDSYQTYSDVLCLALVFGAVLAVTVVLISLAVDLSFLFEGAVSGQFALVVVSALLIASTMLFTLNINFPRALGHVKWYDLLKLGRAVLETSVLLVVFLLGGGVVAGLAALVGVSGLMNVGIASYAITKFHVPPPDPTNFREYFEYGIPMIPKELSGSLLAHTDKYLLLYFVGPTAVGIYAVAQAICKPLVSVTGIFNPTLYPTIAQEWDTGNFDEIARVYGSIFRFYSILGIPATVGMVVLADPLLTIVSTTEIAREGLYLVPIFILGYFVRGYDNSIEYILTSAKRTDVIGGAVTVTAALNLGLNLLLIPRFGMFGGALATLASQLLLFGSLLYFSLSEIRFPIPWRTIARSALAALVMGGLLLSVGPDLGVYATLTVYPPVGAAIYFTVLVSIGEFSESELSRFKERGGDALALVVRRARLLSTLLGWINRRD